MSQFKPYSFSCKCGKEITASLAEILQGNRSLVNRDKILSRTFHRVHCPVCNTEQTVEKDFLYIDTDKKQLFRVLPSTEITYGNKVLPDLREVLNTIHEDAALADQSAYTIRIVCGLEELREKLVLADAGLDDHVVESLKKLVLARAVMKYKTDPDNCTVTIDCVQPEGIGFLVVILPAASSAISIFLKKELLGMIAERLPVTEQAELADKEFRINFDNGRNQGEAIKSLADFAAACPAGPLDIKSPRFRRMLNFLPRGNRLGDTAKADLLKVCEYVKNNFPADTQRTIEVLFEIRFDTELENQWFDCYQNEILVMWKILKDLPDANVEGNVVLKEILIDDKQNGGKYWGGKVYIGENSLSYSYGGTLRHEIGHAVQADRSSLVDGWIKSEFGWEIFEPNDSGVNAWVKAMGGWGTLTGADQQKVRDYITKLLLTPSSNDWQPDSGIAAPGVVFAAEPHIISSAPIQAVIQCTDFGSYSTNWYQYFNRWYVFNGKAFSLNYWYNNMMVVNTKSLDYIRTSVFPSDYAAMSDQEFFAELYMVYYSPGYASGFPAGINSWMEKNIGKSQAGTGAREMKNETRFPIRAGRLGARLLPV